MSAQQNLVPNGSFEDTLGCPDNYDQLYKTNYWYTPTQGTPDYFNSCDFTNSTGVPFNILGNQSARTGNAYVGLVSGFDSISLPREYIQVKLKSKLVPEKKYVLSFYVSLAEQSGYALANLGAVVSKNPINCSCYSYLNIIPNITSLNNIYLNDTINWVEVTDTILAIGDEEYLTIGNFQKTNDTLRLKNNNDYTSYYYIDDVSIFAIDNTYFIPNVFTPNNDGNNDVFYFNTEQLKPISLTIINRWGLKIFESTVNYSWDGRTTSGELCNSGTYYYIIQTETETYKGFLELIR